VLCGVLHARILAARPATAFLGWASQRRFGHQSGFTALFGYAATFIGGTASALPIGDW